MSAGRPTNALGKCGRGARVARMVLTDTEACCVLERVSVEVARRSRAACFSRSRRILFSWVAAGGVIFDAIFCPYPRWIGAGRGIRAIAEWQIPGDHCFSR